MNLTDTYTSSVRKSVDLKKWMLRKHGQVCHPCTLTITTLMICARQQAECLAFVRAYVTELEC